MLEIGSACDVCTQTAYFTTTTSTTSAATRATCTTTTTRWCCGKHCSSSAPHSHNRSRNGLFCVCYCSLYECFYLSCHSSGGLNSAPSPTTSFFYSLSPSIPFTRDSLSLSVVCVFVLRPMREMAFVSTTVDLTVSPVSPLPNVEISPTQNVSFILLPDCYYCCLDKQERA